MTLEEQKSLFKMMIEIHFPEVLQGFDAEKVWERFDRDAVHLQMVYTFDRSTCRRLESHRLSMIRIKWKEVRDLYHS